VSNLIELIKLAAAVGELCGEVNSLRVQNAGLKVSLESAQGNARAHKNCYDFAVENSRYWMGKYQELGAKTAQADTARQQLNAQRNYKERKRKLRKRVRRMKFRPYEPPPTVAQRYWRWGFFQYPHLRAELDAWKAARTK